MRRIEQSNKLLTDTQGTRRQPGRLLVMLAIVAVFAASCASEAGDTAAADEQAGPTSTTVVEVEAIPVPDADVIAFTEAWGAAEAELAWSFVSPRCSGGAPMPDGYVEAVDGYATQFPEATAVNIVVVMDDTDADRATISYDVHDGAGEFGEAYNSQPWAFAEGKWHQDGCPG